MIELQAVQKSWGPVQAVRHVELQAPAGCITTLLGGNGSGKTTTLRMLMGLVRPDRGAIRVAGTDVGRDPVAARRRIGYFPDHPGLNPRLTPVEHWRFVAGLHGMARARIDRRVDELVAELGLEGLARRPVQGFSTGERMLVALGRALVHTPAYLVLDEPARGLDIENLARLRELLRRQRSAGTGILMSSHVLQEVEAVSDRIVVMARGRSLAAGSLEELLARTPQRSLEGAYLQIVATGEVSA